MTAKSTHLKLYTETPPEAVLGKEATAIKSIPKLFSAFEDATGRHLEVLSHAGLDISDGHTWKVNLPTETNRSAYLRVNPSEKHASQTVTDREARRLAKAIGQTLEELSKTQVALRKREAELATGIPVVQHRDEEAHLAERLQAVLKGGVEAVHCEAAAVYLLDDATTQLKLRVSYGLPSDRLTAPARPLPDAMADLEALLGHAVVMEARDISKRWNLPEDYPSAVCVPISTPTTILGTLWFFDSKSRSFDEHDTNLIEVVAGRVGADLEREVLMREGVDSMRLKNQLSAAERRQRNALPTATPIYGGWETAGWVWNSESVGGDFYDWFPLPDKKLALAVGDASAKGVEGAMAAMSLKTALRSHADYLCDTKCLLDRVNLTLWTGSSGDQLADLFCGMAHLDTGHVNYSLSGGVGAIIFRANGSPKILSYPAQPIGESPEPQFKSKRIKMNPGDVLVVFTNAFQDLLDPTGLPIGETGMIEALEQAGPNETAAHWVDAARNLVDQPGDPQKDQDFSVLVLRRRFEDEQR